MRSLFFSPPSSGSSVAACLLLHWSNWTSGLRGECEASSTQTGRHDPEPKGSADRRICVWVLSERLQRLDFFPFTRCLSCSDAPNLKFLRDSFLFFPPPAIVITPLLYCFVCFEESWLTQPPTNQAGVSPPGRCRGQTMQSLVFFMRKVEGHRAHWCCGSDCDVIRSASSYLTL